jgi:choline dehydrogenase-like flavoprotein
MIASWQETRMYFIVGSGPSGIACAQALVKLGCDVTILNGGLELEANKQGIKAEIAQLPPADWSETKLTSLRGEPLAAGKTPIKLAFGSDFPYRHKAGAVSLEMTGVDANASFAVGGLSTVWGSAVLPYLERDLAGWPLSESDLKFSYSEISKFLPLSARADGLSSKFPLYSDHYAPLAVSRQAQRVLERLEKNGAYLNSRGLFFGHSRLAVDASGTRSGKPCALCGRCMHGCPLDLIYSTHTTLKDLLESNRITYKPGFVVQSIKEEQDRVVIQGVHSDGSQGELIGQRVFIGAGLYNTTSILLRSLGMYDTTMSIKDSQYFLLPSLSSNAVSGVEDEALHTLSQLFIEILDKDLSDHTIHLQLYTYNDLFREALESKLGRLGRLFPKSASLGRLLLLQGWIHSDQSSQISATLRRRNGTDVLELTSVENADTKHTVRALGKKLIGLVRGTGILPILPLLDITLPGRGFHSGGSFPMSPQPEKSHTDRLGRPAGLKRTHAIDASVFPTIPATTITFSIMANAHRIGFETAKGDLA